MTTATKVKQELAKHATATKAKASAWFFKTGKGQYGEGDKFIGVTVPEQRAIAKRYEDLPLSGIQKLLDSPIHEHRLTALLILVRMYEGAEEPKQKKIVSFYLRNTKRINNWDLVDSSASYILGDYLLEHDRQILYTLAKSKDLWKRRIAIVATHAMIKSQEYNDTIIISKILLNDNHDLIHKAVGWMLREVGKQDRKKLDGFLEKFAPKLPRTALRYAIEKHSAAKKKYFMKLGEKK